jgi:SAM-dependent methyltransferase
VKPAPRLVRADATALPLGDAELDAALATFLHTDTARFGDIAREVARVLRPGSVFVYVGTHPCFVGPFAELLADGGRRIHRVPSYHDRGWHAGGPGIGRDGVRARLGATYHETFSGLVNAVVRAPLVLERLVETRASQGTDLVGIVSRKPAPAGTRA